METLKAPGVVGGGLGTRGMVVGGGETQRIVRASLLCDAVVVDMCHYLSV